MRLPEYLTGLSPVGETLAAVEAGEAALSAAVAEKNAQLSVSTATSGLSLWEADYNLKDRSGGTMEKRRLDIRTAMAGGRTLTPSYLEELAVTLGGADEGEVQEDFANQKVTLYSLSRNRPPADTAPLKRALDRLKPAHIAVDIVPASAFDGNQTRFSALHEIGRAHV